MNNFKGIEDLASMEYGNLPYGFDPDADLEEDKPEHEDEDF